MAAMLMGTMPLAAQDTPAEKMLSQLKKVKKQGIMFAHQDDPVYGTTWKWDLDRSDVKEVCGDYPALMGFDLGKMELDSKENLDGVPFDRMRHEIIDQHQRGGFGFAVRQRRCDGAGKIRPGLHDERQRSYYVGNKHG